MTSARTGGAADGGRDRIGRAIACRVASVLCIALMAAAVKLASDRGAALVEILFYRGLFSLPLVLLWAGVGPGFASLRVQRPSAHLTRAVLGLMATMMNLQAICMLPLADATILAFSAPLFATMLSALLLAEQVGRHRWIAVIIGLVGVVIVAQPGRGGGQWLGAAFGIGGALGMGLVAVAIRRISASETATSIVFSFTILSIVVTGLGMPWAAQAHDMTTWLLLIGVALASGTSQLFNTASLQLAPVSTTSPFDFTQLLWAVLLGWWIWDSEPGLATWAGAAVIVGSGLYFIQRERVRRRQAR